MGGGGAIQDMINRNKANRALAKSRFSKFEKKAHYSWGKHGGEGYQFKTPDPKEVAALRARLERERARDRRRLWAVTIVVVIGLAYFLIPLLL
ncbi:MAG: hypothetical protein AAGG75_04515 [Bacteroidota bacterium]